MTISQLQNDKVAVKPIESQNLSFSTEFNHDRTWNITRIILLFLTVNSIFRLIYYAVQSAGAVEYSWTSLELM